MVRNALPVSPKRSCDSTTETMANSDRLIVEIADDTLRVTINRPEKRNALSLALLDDLGAVFREQGKSDIKCAILTGAGDRAFAAGGVDYIKKPFIREELLARVRTHINLHVVQQQLNALYQQKTELLTTLAHDIKNPTSAIQGLAPMMIEDIRSDSCSSDELCSMLELIGESACGMTELVNDILNEETQLQGEVPLLTDAQTNAADVVSHLVKLNATQAKEKSIRLKHKPEFDPMVRISRRILTEMFDNIISNAVKYSCHDSEIIIRLSKSNTPETGFRFEVHDNASPIPAETRDALFQKFQKGPQAPLGNSSSHGLGLAIVKRLVDLYEGRIGVYEREDTTGNVFYLEIPIR